MQITAESNDDYRPPVWFAEPPQTRDIVRSIIYTAEIDEGSNTTGTVTVTAAVIQPLPLPGSLFLTLTNPVQEPAGASPAPLGPLAPVVPVTAQTATLTVTIPHMAKTGDPGFRIIGIDYLSDLRGGQPTRVLDFDAVPASAPHLTAYEAERDPYPIFVLTVDVTETLPVTGARKLHTLTYNFGAQANYTPNRDRLQAEVAKRP